MTKAIIIDDDPLMREALKDKLSYHFPDVQLIGLADSGSAGLDLIKSDTPDLVFLDVEMPDMTGFEMLGQLEDFSFKTIFCTSFNHYAIKAIRFNALDYLVKPVDLGELREAMKRFEESRNSLDSVKQAIQNMQTADASDEIMTLQLQDREFRIRLGDIVRIEGERNYSSIVDAKGKKTLTSKTLSTFEEMLESKGFFRCHKSHLINGTHISSGPKAGALTLSNGDQITISRRKIAEFKEWFNA